MINTEVPRELKSKLLSNQMQMKKAIAQHQKLMVRMKEVTVEYVKEIQSLINDAEKHIVLIGVEQKGLVERLRKEYKLHQQKEKSNIIKNGVEDRRVSLVNSFTRARKQNISSIRQSVSPSEDGSDLVSTPTTPEPVTFNPINPQDVSQDEFLTYFGLATHEVFKEIQNKRAERKRRRTANPQFIYSRGWSDTNRKKRNGYLGTNTSPPNTRSRRGCDSKSSRPNSPVETKKNFGQRWPSDLTIEPVKEEQVCSECSKPDNLLGCETCGCAFHVTCHNRPLNQTPKHCPKCLKTIIAHEAEVNEKLALRSQLVEKNKELSNELTKLHDKHTELEESLKTQDISKKKLAATQLTMDEKIQTLIAFIKSFQTSVPLSPAPPTPPKEDEPMDEDASVDTVISNAPPSVESIPEEITAE